jgi:hypothetical protein
MGDLKTPQAEQAERAVLGCLLFAPQTAWSTVLQTGLAGSDFFHPQYKAIFEGIKEAAEAGESLEAIGLFHRLAGQNIPFHLLSDLAGGFPSLEPLPEWCRLVQDAARRRSLLTGLAQATKAISEGQPTGEIVKHLGDAVTVAAAEQGLGSIVQSTFNELLSYDTECDKNTLIGNRWICKGGSVLINAQSGIGKSSLTMQLAIGWAMPRDTPERTVFVDLLTFGIIPVRPLKSLILQAENDIGDQSEILQSVIGKYGKHHCDEAVRRDLNERLVFYRDNVHSGAEFLRVLEALVIKHQPDIAWIDPLMCYVGDDISDQKVVTEFCNGLNRISSKTGVVMALIHHLPKPREGSARTESDLAYAGFGSSALTNWAREVVTLQRVETPPNDPPTCSLTMTKRRLRAGMICWDSLKPSSKIHIRHSNEPDKHGMIWQPCRKPVVEEDDDKPKRRK